MSRRWNNPFSWIILCFDSANEGWRNKVTLSLTGWAHTQNDTWLPLCQNHSIVLSSTHPLEPKCLVHSDMLILYAYNVDLSPRVWWCKQLSNGSKYDHSYFVGNIKVKFKIRYKLNLLTNGWGISCDVARLISLDLTDGMSTLLQVMD